MKVVLLYNVLLVYWSAFLFVVHLSRKDHFVFQFVLFLLWVVISLHVTKSVTTSKRFALLYSLTSSVIILGGYELFQILV
ncbi:hypothetical protein N781_03345 [Pontibacillus halophilus JSM 076056 = DSM 19796]|uniref:Uncharacterized protein n=1 Tax=Pontibacillus halophilus JSM 076056 = DSM 19796 TaxID=1385510 RepID=A0A0A5GKI3_9BACI|nr:hypothetical protein [Pontibacillus halophilus]KGX91670.1 hypothetical protein N781_03345 [Pontibacillus halophilus JSM 076056 = DSM 19796]